MQSRSGSRTPSISTSRLNQGTGPLYRNGWLWAFFALLCAYVLVILASPTAPILQDYPDWVYQGSLFARALARHPVPGYVLKAYPVPNSLTTLGVGGLTAVFGWSIAARLWLTLVLATLGTGSVTLLRRLRVNSYAAILVLASPVILGLDLWDGSINFQFGLGLLLFLLAHLLHPEPSKSVTAVLLLLCFFAHMLPCGAGLLAVLVLALQRRHLAILWSTLPTVLCTLWYASQHDGSRPGESILHSIPALLAVAALLFWFWRREYASRPGFSAGGTPSLLLQPAALTAHLLIKAACLLACFGPVDVVVSSNAPHRALFSPALFELFSFVGVAALIIVCWSFVSTGLRLIRSEDPRRFLFVTAASIGLMFLLMPTDALGVTGIDSRLLHLALACGLGILGIDTNRKLLVLAVLSSCVGAVNLYQFACVQSQPLTISVPSTQTPGFPAQGAAVAPAIRFGYYEHLSQGIFHDWIFPTAMYKQGKP